MDIWVYLPGGRGGKRAEGIRRWSEHCTWVSWAHSPKVTYFHQWLGCQKSLLRLWWKIVGISLVNIRRKRVSGRSPFYYAHHPPPQVSAIPSPSDDGPLLSLCLLKGKKGKCIWKNWHHKRNVYWLKQTKKKTKVSNPPKKSNSASKALFNYN